MQSRAAHVPLVLAPSSVITCAHDYAETWHVSCHDTELDGMLGSLLPEGLDCDGLYASSSISVAVHVDVCSMHPDAESSDQTADEAFDRQAQEEVRPLQCWGGSQVQEQSRQMGCAWSLHTFNLGIFSSYCSNLAQLRCGGPKLKQTQALALMALGSM